MHVRRTLSFQQAKLLGMLAVVASAACYGSLGILAKRGYAAGVGTFTMLAVRFVIASSVLWIVVGIDHRGTRLIEMKRPMIIGATLYALQITLFFAALQTLDVGTVVFTVYLYPFALLVGAAALGRERVTVAKAGSIALAAVGFSLMTSPFDGIDSGILLAAGSALTFAVMLLMLDGQTKASPVTRTTALLTGAAVTFLVVGLLSRRLSIPAGSLPNLVAMGLVATAIPLGLFFYGVHVLGAPWASILSMVEPIFAAAFAAYFLSEGVSLGTLGGGLLILVGSVMIPVFSLVSRSAPGQLARR